MTGGPAVNTVPADIRSPYGAHRRAAVLGSPITHSRSPRIHLAAYRALGLADWRYDRI
ncbi:shikimate dehydrogenase, partial [Gordonia terrae]